jgi:hypothetical protein
LIFEMKSSLEESFYPANLKSQPIKIINNSFNTKKSNPKKKE